VWRATPKEGSQGRPCKTPRFTGGRKVSGKESAKGPRGKSSYERSGGLGPALGRRVLGPEKKPNKTGWGGGIRSTWTQPFAQAEKQDRGDVRVVWVPADHGIWGKEPRLGMGVKARWVKRNTRR